VVAAALGVVQRAQMSLADSIVDHLRARQQLVVLDNCEHLLDAAAELTGAVLAEAPGVRILATSREGLGIPAEHVWPLRSLGVSPDGGGPSDAEVLFADRARAVQPEFASDEASAPVVAELCRRLDGIPLAIELAAARVGVMSPAEIAAHLDERFRLLTGGRRGRVERHQTLRAALEWSYALLTDTERVVFDRLGVFPASFDQTAAVGVCAFDGIERWDVIDALASLVAKSMVGADRSADTTRYQLLETLRAFARDRAGEQIDVLRRRHAAHYAVFAEQGGAGLLGPDELVWRRRVAAELDNLRAATAWALDATSVDDTAFGVRILDALMREVFVQPSWDMAAWARVAVERIDALHAEYRPVVLAAAAFDAYCNGRFESAKALGEWAVSESGSLTPALAVGLNVVAVVALAGGDPAEALAINTEGRQRFQIDSDPGWPACISFFAASMLSSGVGDHDWARSEARRALESARRLQSPTLLVNTLAAHANALSATEPDEALAAAEEAIRLVESGAGDQGYTTALQVAATLRAGRGDAAGAAHFVRTAVEHNAWIGNRTELVTFAAVAVVVFAGPG